MAVAATTGITDLLTPSHQALLQPWPLALGEARLISVTSLLRGLQPLLLLLDDAADGSLAGLLVELGLALGDDLLVGHRQAPIDDCDLLLEAESYTLPRALHHRDQSHALVTKRGKTKVLLAV